MKKRWFTLIEMLIVIVIIGILAGALIPRIWNARDKANDVAREANVKSIATAISQALIDNEFDGICGGNDGDIVYANLWNYWITSSLDGQPTNDDQYRCIELANEHFIVYSEEMSTDSSAANCVLESVSTLTDASTFADATALIDVDDADAYCMVQ